MLVFALEPTYPLGKSIFTQTPDPRNTKSYIHLHPPSAEECRSEAVSTGPIQVIDLVSTYGGNPSRLNALQENHPDQIKSMCAGSILESENLHLRIAYFEESSAAAILVIPLPLD